MSDLKTELITRTMNYELRIIELENKYRETHKEIDEKKLRAFINKNMRKETKELLNYSLKSSIDLMDS